MGHGNGTRAYGILLHGCISPTSRRPGRPGRVGRSSLVEIRRGLWRAHPAFNGSLMIKGGCRGVKFRGGIGSNYGAGRSQSQSVVSSRHWEI